MSVDITIDLNIDLPEDEEVEDSPPAPGPRTTIIEEVPATANHPRVIIRPNQFLESQQWFPDSAGYARRNSSVHPLVVLNHCKYYCHAEIEGFISQPLKEPPSLTCHVCHDFCLDAEEGPTQEFYVTNCCHTVFHISCLYDKIAYTQESGYEPFCPTCGFQFHMLEQESIVAYYHNYVTERL